MSKYKKFSVNVNTKLFITLVDTIPTIFIIHV